MKKIFIVLFVFAFAGALWSESVTEVAKREKERRAQLEKEGKKAKVLTNKDVANIKSSLGIESTSPVADQSGDATDQATSAIQEATRQANEELDQLRQKRDELTGKVQDLSDSIAQTPNANDIGSRYQQKRLTEEELQKVDDQIKAIEAQRKQAAEEKAQEQKESAPAEQPQPQTQN